MAIFEYIVPFVVGAAVGGIIGWKVGEKKLEIEKQAFADRQIEQMRKYYEKKYAQKDISNAEKSPDEKSEETNEFLEVPTEYETTSQLAESSLTRADKNEIKRTNVDATDYTSFWKGGDEPLGTDREYDENYSLGKAETEEAQHAPGPVIMDINDFGADPMMKTVTLNYYTENGVVTVSDDEELEEEEVFNKADIERMIGDSISEYEFDKNDEQTLCIRNEKMGYEYMIVKKYSSYCG